MDNNNISQRAGQHSGGQVLAISYVPIQHADFDKVYDDEKGLVMGTIFPELDLPFLGSERSAK